MSCEPRVRIWIQALFIVCAAWGTGPCVLAQCPPLPPGNDVFPANGKWVIEFLAPIPSPPEIARFSSEGLPDTGVHRSLQVGDTIDQELRELNLSGPSPFLGPVVLRLAPFPASAGRILGVVQDPTTCELVYGDSFFDVFLEIDVPAQGETWFNPDPLRMRRIIHELPPKDEPFEVETAAPVLFFDKLTGTPRAAVRYLLDHADAPFPEADTDTAFLHSTMTNGIEIFPAGYSGVLFSQGNSLVQRSSPLPGFLLQTIDTRVASVTLEGNDPVLGYFVVYDQFPQLSTGQVQSLLPTRSYPAESFFDLYLIFRTQNFGDLHNVAPHRVLATPGNGRPVRNVPFLFDTVHASDALTGPTALYDDSGLLVGQFFDAAFSQSLVPAGFPAVFGEICQTWRWLFRARIFDPYFPGGCTEEFRAGGPARFLAGNDGTSLIAQLHASAGSLCLGDLVVRPSASLPSTGLHTSLAASEIFPMDSFFDVYFDLESDTLGPLHTTVAETMQTTINAMPMGEGEIFFGPGLAAALLDDAGNVVGLLEAVRQEVGPSGPCPYEYQAGLSISTDSWISPWYSPDTGAGVNFDLVRGSFGPDYGTDWMGSFYYSQCLGYNASSPVQDLEFPAPGNMFWYLFRDSYGQARGTYNDTAGLPLDRDQYVRGCNPM